MENLSRIGVFIAVAKQESFAAAARELGITSSAVSKQVQNLEFELKTKLLNRTTRRVSLTEEGAIFYDRASRALDDIREATDQLNELKATPRGPLRVSVPSSFGVEHLVEPIASFAKLYPDVAMDVVFDDRLTDMTQEGFDLSIRIGPMRDSAMIARKLMPCPIYICASAEYIAQHGAPQTPEDLANHNVLAYTRNKGAHELRYRDGQGQDKLVSLHSSFKCDAAEMMVEAACQGLGIIVSPVFFVKRPIDQGRLQRLLVDCETTPERFLFAMFPPNRFLSTRLRLFIDHISGWCTERFTAENCRRPA